MVPDYLFKVAKKKQNFGKVARSCSSAKKLLRGQKVAKKLPSTIWLCLGGGEGMGDVTPPPPQYCNIVVSSGKFNIFNDTLVGQ